MKVPGVIAQIDSLAHERAVSPITGIDPKIHILGDGDVTIDQHVRLQYRPPLDPQSLPQRSILEIGRLNQL